MQKTIGIILMMITLSVGLVACQPKETTPPPTTPPSTQKPTVIPPPPLEKVVVPEQPPTPPVQIVPPPTENVTIGPPPAPLPNMVSLTPDLRNVELTKITAVFRFDTTMEPGFYTIRLISGGDDFGNHDIEWYRATRQLTLEWSIPAGKDAYYRLRNNEPVAEVVKTEVSYRKFVSLTSIPRETPSDLERDIVELVNKERLSRGLSQLTWDDDLYKQAMPRLKQFGEEGTILPPLAGQPETAYLLGGGLTPNAVTVFQSWTINEVSAAVLTTPGLKSIAIRTDSFNNKKLYIVGLYK